jgi:hypothetical protein
MERLFTLVMTFGYGAIMVWMYIAAYLGWTGGKRSVIMLVAPWIQFMVFMGGVILLAMFFILLFNFRRAAHAHHEHGENEEEADEQDSCSGHEHDHHGHSHNHNHEHKEGCCDHGHEHGWTPARYIPLLIPLILFLMGLPDDQMIRSFERYLTEKALQGQTAYNAKGEELAPTAAWLALTLTEPQLPVPQLAAVGNALQSASEEIDDNANNKPPVVTDLAQIERVLMDPTTMAVYQRYPKVELDGMFSLENQGGASGLTIFRVVRLRMACCLNDSRPASIICATRKKIDPELLKPGIGSEARWCKAQGKLKFGPGPDGKNQAFLKVSSVVSAPMPPFPYLN